MPPSSVEPESVQPHSAKSVQFDLNPKERSISPLPESEPDHDERDEKRKRRERDRDRDRDRERSGRRSKESSRRDGSPDSDDSGATIELPPRFDERGRRKDDDPLANQLEHVLTSLFA